MTEGEKKLRGALTRLGFENADDVVDALLVLTIEVFITQDKILDVVEYDWTDSSSEGTSFTVYTEPHTP